jgi:hypothetical protein
MEILEARPQHDCRTSPTRADEVPATAGIGREREGGVIDFHELSGDAAFSITSSISGASRNDGNVSACLADGASALTAFDPPIAAVIQRRLSKTFCQIRFAIRLPVQ